MWNMPCPSLLLWCKPSLLQPDTHSFCTSVTGVTVPKSAADQDAAANSSSAAAPAAPLAEANELKPTGQSDASSQLLQQRSHVVSVHGHQISLLS